MTAWHCLAITVYPNNLTCLQQYWLQCLFQLCHCFSHCMTEATYKHDFIIVTSSFWLDGMTLLGENGVPKQLNLSPTILTLVFIATVGLLLTWFRNDWSHIWAQFTHSNILVLIGWHNIAWQKWCTQKTWLVSHNTVFSVCSNCMIAFHTWLRNG